jgi:putative transposase
MARKRFTAEQIIKLREAEVELAKGQPPAQVCRRLGVTEATYYRWRKEYGGLRVNQAKGLSECIPDYRTKLRSLLIRISN